MLDRLALDAVIRAIFRNEMESVNVRLAIGRSTIPSVLLKKAEMKLKRKANMFTHLPSV